jgi:hypothetical protein
MKMVGYTSRYNALIDRYGWNYNFEKLARQQGLTMEELINRTFLHFALQVINKPRQKYSYEDEPKMMTKEYYARWEVKWMDWMLEHLEWIMLYHASIRHYIGLDFVNINMPCRVAERQEFADYTFKLLQLCGNAPRLPQYVSGRTGTFVL